MCRLEPIHSPSQEIQSAWNSRYSTVRRHQDFIVKPCGISINSVSDGTMVADLPILKQSNSINTANCTDVANALLE